MFRIFHCNSSPNLNQFTDFPETVGVWTLEREVIGINHGFQCSNIRWITGKVFEHKAAGRMFKHLPSDPANV